MKLLVVATCAAALCAPVVAQPPSPSERPPTSDLMWDHYDPVIRCVADKAVGHSFNENPVDMVPVLLGSCKSEMAAARNMLRQLGYSQETASDVEREMQDLLLTSFTADFAKRRADEEPERAFARSIYKSALSCASKLAIDYKEMSAGDPDVFFDFLSGQCTFRKEIDAAMNSGLKGERLTSAGITAKTCGFAKAMDNLKYRLGAELADAYRACPAYLDMINGRPPS